MKFVISCLLHLGRKSSTNASNFAPSAPLMCSQTLHPSQLEYSYSAHMWPLLEKLSEVALSHPQRFLRRHNAWRCPPAPDCSLSCCAAVTLTMFAVAELSVSDTSNWKAGWWVDRVLPKPGTVSTSANAIEVGSSWCNDSNSKGTSRLLCHVGPTRLLEWLTLLNGSNNPWFRCIKLLRKPHAGQVATDLQC